MNWTKGALLLGCAICCREAAPDRHSPASRPPPSTAIDFEIVEPKALHIHTTKSLRVPSVVPTVDNTSAFGLATETKGVRRDLRSMECFIEHELRVEKGEAPAKWRQPDFSTYDNFQGDPCTLMPER